VPAQRQKLATVGSRDQQEELPSGGGAQSAEAHHQGVIPAATATNARAGYRCSKPAGGRSGEQREVVQQPARPLASLLPQIWLS